MKNLSKKYKKLKMLAQKENHKLKKKNKAEMEEVPPKKNFSKKKRFSAESSKSATDVGGTLKRFKQMDDDARRAYCTDDVYSKQWKPPKFDKNDPSYGRPKEGSLTEQRGIAAGHHVCKEIIQLCEIIDENGARQTDGTVVISFGELFKTYQWISDKVVGMLLRARKHKLVDFEGEMLYQRRDEQVPVTLIRTMGEVRQMYSQTDDPKSVLKNIW